MRETEHVEACLFRSGLKSFNADDTNIRLTDMKVSGIAISLVCWDERVAFDCRRVAYPSVRH